MKLTENHSSYQVIPYLLVNITYLFDISLKCKVLYL